MDRMGVSGTLDIGSIPIRATNLKARWSRGFYIFYRFPLLNIMKTHLILLFASISHFKEAKICIFLLFISKIRSNIAPPVWEYSFLAQLVRARDC